MTQINGLPVGLPSIIGGAEEREAGDLKAIRSVRPWERDPAWWRVEVSLDGVFLDRIGWARSEVEANQVAGGMEAELAQQIARTMAVTNEEVKS